MNKWLYRVDEDEGEEEEEEDDDEEEGEEEWEWEDAEEAFNNLLRFRPFVESER